MQSEYHKCNNQITTLPESFGSVQVGGDLYLDENELTTLPASFGSVIVGGDLNLYDNQWSMRLPESFPNVKGSIRWEESSDSDDYYSSNYGRKDRWP